MLVNELLRLWKEGIIVYTPKYPFGRLLRVLLVGLICDKPAAHKLAGYGSHSHTFFCHLCWIEKQKIAQPEAFTRGGLSLSE